MRRWLSILLLLIPSVAALADNVRLPDYERVVLPNGAVLLIAGKHDVPLVGLEVVIRGGAVTDPPGREGLSSLAAQMLEKGAGERSAAEFAEAVESVGGSLSVDGGREAVSISAEFLARDANLMVELVAEMLQRPQLDSGEFEKLRKRRIDLIRAAKDGDPSGLVPAYRDAFLFGEHPYGAPPDGSEDSLAAISHKDLRQYYENHIGGDRLIIAAVGDFDVAAMRTLLSLAFGEWRPAAASLPTVAAASRRTGRHVLLVDKPGATQTYFTIANVGVAIDFPERPALDLANTVFGGRFTSMLNSELRVRTGLSYSAWSSLVRPSRPGALAITSFTETGTTVDAIDLALATLGRLRDEGVHVESVVSARNYVMGQFPPRLETNAQLAGQFAMLELYGLDRSYVDAYGDALGAVTAADVRSVIDAVYPPLEDLVFVLIGDAAAIREAVKKYGDVTEMPITSPRFSP